MRLMFKQRLFSWFDSYDIFDEAGNTVYTVKGQLSWGHRLHILDAAGTHIATVQQRVFSFLPRFEMYLGETYLGCIRKDFTLFMPHFTVEYRGWDVSGSLFEWDYTITSGSATVATISKEIFNWTDTYVIDVNDPADALFALMLVIAIDAEKCSRN